MCMLVRIFLFIWSTGVSRVESNTLKRLRRKPILTDQSRSMPTVTFYAITVPVSMYVLNRGSLTAALERLALIFRSVGIYNPYFLIAI